MKAGKNLNAKQQYLSKFNRLIIPYLSWGLLLVMIFPSIYKLDSLLYGISHLWFLLMLFGIFVIVIVFGKMILNPHFLSLILIASFIIDICISKFVHVSLHYFAIRLTINYLPVFLWGIYCSIFNLPEKVNKWNNTSFYISLSVTSLCVIASFMIKHIPYGSLFIYLVQYLFLLLIYTFLKYKLNIKSTHPLLANLDKQSMGIYIIHHILIWVALIYIPPVKPFMNQHYILAPILLFVGVFIVSWLLSEAMHLHKYTRYLIGSK